MLPNEILQGRLVRGIQRFFGIQGDAAVPQLAAEVMASYDLSRIPTDHRYLFDERISGRYFDALGDATHPGQVQLYNPTGSGQLVTVTRIHLVQPAAAAPVYVELRDANAASLVTGTAQGQVMDARWFARVATTQLRMNVATNNVGGILLGYLQPGMTHEVPYVLTPGTWISLITPNNAERVLGHIQWIERALPDLEARF